MKIVNLTQHKATAEQIGIRRRKMNMRELRAIAIRDEIENLFEDAAEDDDAFDQLLADIDELIQEYRI